MSKNLDNEFNFEFDLSIEEYEMDSDENELTEAIQKISNKPSNFIPLKNPPLKSNFYLNWIKKPYKTLTRKLNNYFF